VVEGLQGGRATSHPGSIPARTILPTVVRRRSCVGLGLSGCQVTWSLSVPAAMSDSLTMLYRLKMLRVLWPESVNSTTVLIFAGHLGLAVFYDDY
jgi:hypothetical protein